MSLLSKLSTELRGAGAAARGAIDEGKVRLELFRVRQLADKAAQALGYAVHRAARDGKQIEPGVLASLGLTLEGHEVECRRLQEELVKLNTVSNAPPPKP